MACEGVNGDSYHDITDDKNCPCPSDNDQNFLFSNFTSLFGQGISNRANLRLIGNQLFSHA